MSDNWYKMMQDDVMWLLVGRTWTQQDPSTPTTTGTRQFGMAVVLLCRLHDARQQHMSHAQRIQQALIGVHQPLQRLCESIKQCTHFQHGVALCRRDGTCRNRHSVNTQKHAPLAMPVSVLMAARLMLPMDATMGSTMDGCCGGEHCAVLHHHTSVWNARTPATSALVLRGAPVLTSITRSGGILRR